MFIKRKNTGYLCADQYASTVCLGNSIKVACTLKNLGILMENNSEYVIDYVWMKEDYPN